MSGRVRAWQRLPVIRQTLAQSTRIWSFSLSLVERFLDTEEAAGSNPATTTGQLV